MKKFIMNPITGKTEEMKPDVYTAKFEHIATKIPVEIELTEHEFKLLTSKVDMDKKTDQAWLSMWLRDTDIRSNTGPAEDDIEEFFNQHFFDGVFCNGRLRSH